MATRVVVQWTETARNQLAKLPKKVRRGILDKAGLLRDSPTPELVHKPLAGPLEGYYRFTYARYRAVYSVKQETIANGDILVHIVVTVIAVGKRSERDRQDIYRLAERLVKNQIVRIDE